jgi:hypothetical protein
MGGKNYVVREPDDNERISLTKLAERWDTKPINIRRAIKRCELNLKLVAITGRSLSTTYGEVRACERAKMGEV